MEAPKPAPTNGEDEPETNQEMVVADRKNLTPTGAKIKVQPQTFFANERTLLSWINCIVLLSSIALALINFGDDKSRLTGYFFVPVVALFSLYALLVFHFRLRALTWREESFALTDNIGPYALVGTIIFALLLSIFVPALTSAGPVYQVGNYPRWQASIYPPGIRPDYFQVTGRINQDKFRDRIAGLTELRARLKSGTTTLAFEDNGTTVISTRTYQRLPGGGDNLANGYFTYYSANLSGNANTPDSTELVFLLDSTLPGFSKVTMPVSVLPNAKDRSAFFYGLDCNSSRFYHRTAVNQFSSAAVPATVGDLDKVFKNVATDLNQSKSTSFEFLDTRYFYAWRSGGTLGSKSFFSMEVLLEYNISSAAIANVNDSTYYQIPEQASFTMTFDADFVSNSALVSARQYVSELIFSEFTKTDIGIPGICVQP